MASVRYTDIILALIAMATWGFNFAVVKLALADLPPILLAALRFTLVAALLVPFRRAPRPLLPVLGLAVTLGCFHFPIVFLGMRWVDASTGAIIMQFQTIFAAALASLFLKDRLGARGLAGLLIAVAGGVMIAGAPRLEGNRLGVLFLLIGSFAWGVSNIQLKRLKVIDPFRLNGWLALFSAIELYVFSSLAEGPALPRIAATGWRGWFGVLYTAVFASIVGYGLWMRLVARYSVNRMTPFMLTVPMFGVLAGVVAEGDRITPEMATGGLMTIAGVALTTIRRPPPAALAAEPAA